MSIQSIVIYSDRCEFFNFFRKWFVSGPDFRKHRLGCSIFIGRFGEIIHLVGKWRLNTSKYGESTSKYGESTSIPIVSESKQVETDSIQHASAGNL